MAFRVKCSNENCKKWFNVIDMRMGVPGGKDKEEYYCPYCYHEVGYIMTDGYVRTEKIEPQPEE